jgi:hypothetical protein
MNMTRGSILWPFALYCVLALGEEGRLKGQGGQVPCSLDSVASVEIDPTGTTLDLFPLSIPLAVTPELSFAGLHDSLHDQLIQICIEAAALHSASRLFKKSDHAPESLILVNLHSGPEESSSILKVFGVPWMQSRKSAEDGLQYRRQLFSNECITSADQLITGWTIDDCVDAMEAQIAAPLAELISSYEFEGAEGKWSGELYWPGFSSVGRSYGISWGEDGCADDLLRQVDEWVVSKCGETQSAAAVAEGGGLNGVLRKRPPHPFVLSGLELSTVALTFPSTKPQAAAAVEASDDNDARLPWSRDLILQRTALNAAVPNALTVPVSLVQVRSLAQFESTMRPQFDEVCAQNLPPRRSDVSEPWTVDDCARNLNDQLAGFVKGVSTLLFDPLPPTPPRFFSLGLDCSTPFLLRYLGLREASTPFDWTVCPLSTVAAVLSGEMTNITEDTRSMNHFGGNRKKDPYYYLHKPFSAASNMLFSHDGDCDDTNQASGDDLTMTAEEQRAVGKAMEPCSMETSFHEKYARRMARFRSSILGVEGGEGYGGITYLVYFLQPKPEKNLLNQTTFPEYTIENQLAAVTKLKSLFRGREDVRVVSTKEVLPFARRECVAKLRRQRKVSLLLGHHTVVSSRDGPVTLTDPIEINEALQVFSNQFCGLTQQPKNWIHPDSNQTSS